MVQFVAKHPEVFVPLLALASSAPLLIVLFSQRISKVRRRRAAASANASRDRWIIIRGTEMFDAPSIDEVAALAATGQVVSNDDVYDPSTGRWSRASSYPAVAAAINERFNRLYPSSRTPSSPAEVGCTILGVAVVAVIFLVILVSSDQKRLREHPTAERREAEFRLDTEMRKYLPPDAETRIVREGWTNSVTIYARKSEFEEIPFPDRPTALRSVASAWCKSEGTGWLTTVSVRDIRTGEELASTRCE